MIANGLFVFAAACFAAFALISAIRPKTTERIFGRPIETVDRLVLVVFACFGVLMIWAAIWPISGQKAIDFFAGCMFAVIGAYTFVHPGKVRSHLQSRQPFKWARDSMESPINTVILWLMSIPFMLVGAAIALRSVLSVISTVRAP